MKQGELRRVRFAFGALGAVPVFLVGWLGWLQVAQAGELDREGRAPLQLVPATADRQSQRAESVPAPRGTIVDRNGSMLAIDREVYEVRASVVVPKRYRRDVHVFTGWLARLAEDLAKTLVADPELPGRDELRRRHAQRLAGQFARAFRTDALPAAGALPEKHPVVADLLVANGIDVLSVVQALRGFCVRHAYETVTLHFLRSFERAYPDREFTFGLVGHVDTRWESVGHTAKSLVTQGVCGLESFVVLDPSDAQSRSFLNDGTGRSYFQAPFEDVRVPNVLQATLDIELQRIAVRELTAQANAVGKDATASIPKWGALVLVEVATGDVLAAASWHRGDHLPQATAFTPYQSLCEPGSIVKPLVFAYALEAGVLDWSHVYDCRPGGATYREVIAQLGRAKPVRDDHDCADLTPHGIIVNSSNIGASYVGLGLSRDQWRDYMSFYGFGTSLRLNLPHECLGGPNPLSFDPNTSTRGFRANSAISFSFGYELGVSAMHLARAYLRMLRGKGAELRLCRGVEIGGRWYDAPSAAGSGPRFRRDVVEAVTEAMADVVSDDPHATGHHVHARMLKELGIDLHRVIAGKTGTAASRVGIPGRGSVNVRNASFVGLLPVESPRWLAVCVLQKDDSALFYGGSYAAPPAVRLLLRCQELEGRRQLRQESQSGSGGQARATSGSPGDSGWSPGASEKQR
ncbi:MAG TPA: penicillin-binding transpeptidase domain-containing protein [Planctomycetota bacterium]|nr:penicillin-binding transpeptidase domain-containing protein [Planctomycetota bacterium]